MNTFRFSNPSAFPPVVKNLIIINVLVFIAQKTVPIDQLDINGLFALHDIHSVYFKPWQLLTYQFMHGGIDHIFFNMFALWMFGSVLENHLNSKRFLIYYLLCGIGAGLVHLGVLYMEMQPAWDYIRSFPVEEQVKHIYDPNIIIQDKGINGTTVGASGSIFGCLAAFGYLFPNSMIYLYFTIPMKAKWFVIIYAAIELLLGIKNSAGDVVAHFAHLGGALTGIIILLIWNKTNRRTLY